MRQTRKKVEAFVPMGKTRVRVGLLVRRSETLQEIGRRCLASNTLVRSAPKRVAVRVNGGLARGGHRRESAGDPIERRDARRVGLRRMNGAGPAKTQDDVRASFSGRLVTQKVVRRSRDRGCNGHRIL